MGVKREVRSGWRRSPPKAVLARLIVSLALVLVTGAAPARMVEFEQFGVSEQARECYFAQRVLARYEPVAHPLDTRVHDVGGPSALGFSGAVLVPRAPVGDVRRAYRCYYFFPVVMYA